MAVFEVAVVTFVVESGWASVVPVGLGASLGIVCSMLLYHKTKEHGLLHHFKTIITEGNK